MRFAISDALNISGVIVRTVKSLKQPKAAMQLQNRKASRWNVVGIAIRGLLMAICNYGSRKLAMVCALASVDCIISPCVRETIS